jgi:uncharacterized NAD(P)/FAD-binding protein YdhS
MNSSVRTVAIVGAGFSGTTLAVNLLRLVRAQPLRIVLVERSQLTGGVAYARRRYPYLLNVPAGRMSANAFDPGEFLAFARRWQPSVTADDFLPRELYGEYLEASLASAQATSAPHVELKRLCGSVIAIERAHRDRVLHLHLADGRRLSAQTAVLALGNPSPAPLSGSEALRGTSRYFDDPWQVAPQIRAGETVLVAGTGLTMADTVLAGMHAGWSRVVFHVLSRHGLLPLRQTPFPQLEDCDGAPLVSAASMSLLHLFRAIRALSDHVQRGNGDWPSVIALVRDLAPTLWRRLRSSERRRFLRHVRCYWDVHRHRLPEPIWTALNELRRSGNLQVHAGRIVAMEPAGKRVRVTWRPRGTSEMTTLSVDRVINCSGPDYDVRHTQDRLLRSLLAQGIAVRDPLGQGLVTDETGALVGVGGRAARDIFYLGPLLRAAHWETTAVTELRAHAARLARHLTMAGAEEGRSSSACLRSAGRAEVAFELRHGRRWERFASHLRAAESECADRTNVASRR